jgi:hypothetical protein
MRPQTLQANRRLNVHKNEQKQDKHSCIIASVPRSPFTGIEENKSGSQGNRTGTLVERKVHFQSTCRERGNGSLAEFELNTKAETVGESSGYGVPAPLSRRLICRLSPCGLAPPTTPLSPFATPLARSFWLPLPVGPWQLRPPLFLARHHQVSMSGAMFG